VFSPRVTWFSLWLIMSSFFLTWVSSFFIMCPCFWHGFHHVSSWFHCLFTCMVFIMLLHVLAVFNPKCHVCVFNTSAPRKQETAFTFTRILKNILLLDSWHLALICFSFAVKRFCYISPFQQLSWQRKKLPILRSLM
jgi:hypothetical protein